MLEQLNNSVKFVAFFVASKVGKTLLTPTVDVYNPAGTKIVTDGTTTEIGGGLYSYTLASASVTTEGEYLAVFKTTDTTVEQQHLPALWIVGRAGIEDLDAAISSRLAAAGYTSPDNVSIAAILAKTDVATSTRLAAASYTAPPSAAVIADAVYDEVLAGQHDIAGSAGKLLQTAGTVADPLLNTVPGAYASGTAGAALGRIGSGQISTTSIVAGNGDITIHIGDDYNSADGRAIDWTDTNVSWPDLTGASIKAKIAGASVTGSVVVASGAGKKVRIEPTAAQTATMKPGQWPFDVQATLTNGRIVTLLSGIAIVQTDITT